MSQISLNRTIGILTIRLVLGLIFFMQGFGKVFTWGMENVYNADFFYGTFKDKLPDFLIYATAFYTSYVELIGGFLLIFGFKIKYALYALASVLVVVTFGHGLAEPIWDLSHVIFRLILLVSLLLLPRDWDRFSLDDVIKKYIEPNKK